MLHHHTIMLDMLLTTFTRLVVHMRRKHMHGSAVCSALDMVNEYGRGYNGQWNTHIAMPLDSKHTKANISMDLL